MYMLCQPIPGHAPGLLLVRLLLLSSLALLPARVSCEVLCASACMAAIGDCLLDGSSSRSMRGTPCCFCADASQAPSAARK